MSSAERPRRPSNRRRAAGRGRIPRYAILISLLLMSAIGYLWEHAEVSALAEEIASLANRKSALETHNDVLRLEIGSIWRSERLQAILNEQLGLAYPTAQQVVFIATADPSLWSRRETGPALPDAAK